MTSSRHIAVVLALGIAALAAGVALIPGDREQLTMMLRDERDAEPLRLLQREYDAGERDPQQMLHLYQLLMSFAEIGRATHIVEELASKSPNDVSALTLLAKHYADTQNQPREIATLERLFKITGAPAMAQRLLVLYRFAGRTADETQLLQKLLSAGTITAGDAERLGFMLASNGDWEAARAALVAFDKLAPIDDSIGRPALFDVMVRLGQSHSAMTAAERWLTRWRAAHVRRGLRGREFATSRDFPLSRVVEEMSRVDAAETQRVVCSTLADYPGAIALLPKPCASWQATGPAAVAHAVAIASLVVTTRGDGFDRSTP
jgi:tetratricopeptide (TPR) repeat protein